MNDVPAGRARLGYREWTMLVLGIAVAVALLVPLVTGGSYSRLVMTRWTWSPLLFIGLALQLSLDLLPIPESRWDDIGYALLLASYACIVAFCARNVVLRGMAIVLIGVACNVIVIALNQGMPVDLPPDMGEDGEFEATIKHHPQDEDDRLTFLGDIIVLRSPFDTAISFGDLIIGVGLCDVTYHASRRRKSRSLASTNGSRPQPVPALAAGIDLAPMAPTSVRKVATDQQVPTDQPELVTSATARSSALSTRSS